VGKTQQPKTAAAEGSRSQRGRKIPVHPDRDILVPLLLSAIKKASATVPLRTLTYADYISKLLPGGPCLTVAQQTNLPDLDEFTTAGRRTVSPQEEELITACATCDAHQGHHQEDPIDLTQDQIDLTHDEDGSLNNPIDLSDDIKHNTHTDTSVTCYLCKDGRKDNHEEDGRTSPQPIVTTWAQNQHDNGQVSCLQAEGQRRADQRSAFSTTEQTWC